MNFQCNRSGANRTVVNPIDTAGSFSQTDVKKDCGLSLSNFVRISPTSSSGAHFLSCFFRYDMPPSSRGMSFPHVLFRCNPFQVIGTVITSVAIYVVNKMRFFRLLKPADGDHTVDKKISAYAQITVRISGFWFSGEQLSKNFPIARNCVLVIKEFVLSTFKKYAQKHDASYEGSISYVDMVTEFRRIV